MKAALTRDAKNGLAQAGIEVLRVFPLLPGSCALMTALYAVVLEKSGSGPVSVVAGDLSVPGCRVFGDGSDGDLSQVFERSEPSWDGHCWIVLGRWIADVSIFRTARSDKAPPALALHVSEVFGPKTGLLIDTPAGAAQMGFIYRPRYVLTSNQVDGLARGAMAMVQSG